MTSTTTALTAFKATLSAQSRHLISKNENSNENTSTLRKASVDTTTSPDVPQATAPAELKNAPSSPPGISTEWTSPLSQDKDRDLRAYEHERQRAKHAGDRAKRLARKATKGVGRASAVHAGRRFKNKKVGVDVDVYAVTPQGRDTERTTDGLGAGLLKRVPLPSSGGECGADVSKVVTGAKVNLSEIMVLSQKKLRNLNVDGFEVIPHIRSVIALDDIANVHDMDLDEPWEHIYANNGEGKASGGVGIFGRASYARVAGTECQ